MEKPTDFLRKPVAVVGMGLSGSSIERLLTHCGFSKQELFSFDDKPGSADFGDPEKLLREAKPQTLVVSPGVPLSTPWIQDFKDQGGAVTSELTIAYQFLNKEHLICVTGSVGKSTTVSLLEAALKEFSPESFVGGNLGRPLADYVLELLQKKRKPAPWVVLELSSYQLENFTPLRCEFSAITYLTANHMERYDSLRHYYDTKWDLVKRTTNVCVLNRRGGDLLDYAKGKKESCSLLYTDQNDADLDEYELDQAKLLGSHNQDNLAVAARLAREAQWPREAFQAMKDFPGLSHRMENLGQRQGILFVNDSKATTMESVKTAVMGLYDRMDRKTKLIVLLGGKDKNLPWQELGSLKNIPNLRPVFFGDVAEKAQKLSGLEGPCFPKLAIAFAAVKQLAAKGDTVLLSPGGTSWDEFKNFEERGKKFLELVERNFS